MTLLLRYSIIGRGRACPPALLATLVLLALFLSACATTSEPVQRYMPVSSPAAPGSMPDQESKLQNLSHMELIARGNRYLAGNNENLARVHFRAALQKQGDQAPAYAGLGETLVLAGEKRGAHEMFAKALAIDGNNRQALLATGKLYRIEKNYQQAEFFYNRAGEIYPDDPEILTELAIIHGQQGQDERAETLMRQVVALKPQDPSAYNNLGFNYLLLNKYVEAIEVLRKALSLAPDNTRIQNNLAAAYAMNNKSQQAFNLLRQTEGEAAAYNDMGYFFMMRGLKDPAKDSFEKALALHPRHYVRARENLRLLEEVN